MPDGNPHPQADRHARPFGGRYGSADDDPSAVAARHAEAIALLQPAAARGGDRPRPWVERLGRHFLLGRERPGK
jgi:hypothetical protein